MTTPNFITPPREEEEVYPYRRAWQSLIIEVGLLIGAATALVGASFVGIALPRLGLGNWLLAVLPALLWLVISYWRERFAIEPRRGLMTTFIVSALVANAIGVPILNDIVQPERWLALESTLTRILGYAATVALVHETLKYLVLRYVTFPAKFRVRSDGVAYAAACALGYATVLNLHYIAANLAAPPDVALVRIMGTTTLHIATAVIISYGLIETWFSRANALLMPLLLVVAALTAGAAIPLRAGFENAPLVFGVSPSRLYFGLAFSIIVSVGVLIGMGFLYYVADHRDRSARQVKEATP